MKTALRRYVMVIATLLSVVFSLNTIDAQITGASSVIAGTSTTYTAPATAITGGSIVNSGGYNIHTFTSNGSFSLPTGFSINAELLVVGGGGGGGNRHAGGGGAGGLIYASSATINGFQSVAIGAGGAGSLSSLINGSNGGSTTFGGLTAIGGGGGGSNNIAGNAGGSGGGGSNGSFGGAGTSGQGFAGGNQNNGLGCCWPYGNGGGGATAAGASTAGGAGSAGGAGFTTSISGVSASYAGGGGGGNADVSTVYPGGIGGGGAGANATNMTGSNATPNTGGGGGGGGATGSASGNGGAGASGIVIVKYLQPSTGVWASSNTAVATVNPSTGVVTGVSAGTANITYTVSVGGVNNVTTKQVTVTPAPVISSFSPSTGTQGNLITISGSAFTGATAVSIGGKSVVSFTVVNDNTINAVVGAGNSGNIVVTVGSATATSSSAFTYVIMPTPGNALQFDGSDYVEGTNVLLPQGNAAMSIEAWINPSNTNNGTIFNWGNFSAGQRAGLLYIGGKIYFVGQNNDLSGVSTLPLNKWSHLAVTFDGTTMKLYVNGLLDNSASKTLTTLGTSFRVGVSSSVAIGSAIEYFSGAIDEVRVYKSALTQANIQADMFSTASSVPANLVAYYNFDEGTAGGTNTGITTLVDQTGNGNGILNTMTLSGTTSNWVESYAMVRPGGLGYCCIVSTSFTPRWSAPTLSTAASYILDVSTSPTFTSTISGSPFTTTGLAYTLTGLTPGTTYYFRVSADKGTGIGQSINSVTVAAPMPQITAGPVSGSISSCMGSASVSPNVQQFSVSGINLLANIVVTAPANFEISTVATSGFVNSITFTPSGGTVAPTIIYVRSAATAPAGTLSGVVSVVCSHDAVSANVSATINALPNATITAGGPTTSCTGGSVTLTASAGSSYLWSTGETTQAITVSAAGSYTVTVTNASGCSASSSPKVITVNNSLPVVNITAGGSTTFCPGGSVNLTASGSAIDLNGSNQYIGMSAGYPATSNLTYEAWVYPKALAANNFNVILNHAGWSAGYVHFQFANGVLGFSVNGNSPTDYTSTFAFTPNNWYHIAAVYSQSAKTVKMYVNGNLINTYSYTTAVSVTGNIPFKIGAWDGQRFFNGTIDEVRIWNTARTDAEILSNMNSSIAANSPGLVGYYRMDERTGTTTADASGSNPGTLVNGATWVNSAPALLNTYLWSNGLTIQTINATTAGSYSVTATNASGCSINSTATVVTVNPLPTAFTVSGGGSYCTGGAGVSISISNSELGVNYQLKNGTSNVGVAVAGTGAAINFGNQTAAGTYTVAAVNATTGCSNTMTGSANVVVTALPAITIASSGATTFCLGGTTTLSANTGAGNGLKFNGASTYVDLGTGVVLPTTFTEEAWIYSGSGNDGQFHGFLGYQSGSGSALRAPSMWIFNGKQIHGGFGTGSGFYYYITGDVILQNTWNHIAQTYDGIKLRVYVNGTEITTLPTNNQPPLNSVPYNGGVRNIGRVDNYFNGVMDEVRLWNVTRTQAQIQASMNKTIAVNTPGLVGYFKMDEGAGTTTADATTGATGTLTNAPVWTVSSAPVGATITWSPSTGLNTTTGAIAIATPTSTTTYTATATDASTGCIATASQLVTVNPLPVTPTGNNASRCGTGSVTISATPGAGETIDWYATATGGTALLSSSNSYTTPNISANTTYYAEARNTTTGCVSATRKAIVVTVVSLPLEPTGTDAARCLTGSVTLSATPGSGEVIDWYATATGGTALLVGSNSYTTPGISSTTSYYAEARNTTTGCVSASRKLILAIVNALPVPTITAAGPTSFCAGGSVGLSATGFGNNSIQLNGSGQFFRTANLRNSFPTKSITIELWFKASAAGVIAQELGQSTGVGGWHNTDIEIQSGGNVKLRFATLTPIDIGIASFNVWHHVAIRYNATTQVLDGFLDGVLSPNTTTGNRVQPNFSPFDGQYWAFGQNDSNNMGTGSFLNGQIDEVRIWNVAVSNSQITQNYLQSIPANSANLVAYYSFDKGSGTAVADETSNGYNGLLFGTPTPTWVSNSNAAFTSSYANSLSYVWSPGGAITSGISATTGGSYTVAITDASGCTGTSTPTVITVNQLPAAPTGSDASNCGTGSVTISATAGLGETIDWYTAASGGSLLATGNSFTTSSISSTTIYYAEARNITTGCVSATRTAVTATINAIPVAIINAGGPTTFCSGGSVTLTAFAGSTYLWSNGATTQSITVSTVGSYTVVVSSATCSSTASAATTITVTQPIVPSFAQVAAICAGSSAILPTTSTNGITGTWSPALNNTATTTYTFTPTTGQCATTATMTIVVNPLPTPTIIASGPTTICNGSSVVLSAITGAGNMLSFNGTNQKVQISNLDISPSVIPELTVSAWVKRTGIINSWGAVVSNDDGGYDRAIMVNSDGNYHIFAGRDINTGIPSVIGTWDFITVSWSSSAVTVYKNGVQVFTTSGESFSSGSMGTGIGASALNSWYFPGSIDQVSLWNSTRSVNQIQAEMNTFVTGNESGIVACYNFNEGSGENTADASVNARTGSLVNNPTWSASTVSTENYSYLWNPGEANTSNISVTAAGSYTVTVTNASGCSATSSATTITVNALPTLSVNASATSVCAGTPVTLTGSGASTYTWTGGITNGVSFIPSVTNTYILTGIDVNGCSNTTSATITVNSMPVVSQISTGITAVDYLVVAGGGGGASGGGGGGGVLSGTNYAITPNQSIAITVGAGGAAGVGGALSGSRSSNGGNSIFANITAIGGGAGGGNVSQLPLAGGSGGGGGFDRPSITRAAGTVGQGNNGGRTNFSSYGAGAGGGGAAAAGSDATVLHIGGNGGNGISSSISGTLAYYGGGGGGGINDNNNATTLNGGGKGGLGGGGNGSSMGYTCCTYFNGTSGTPGTGGGGGGTDPESSVAGSGGSGIVIIRYPGAPSATGGTITQSGGYTIHTFTSVGANTFTNGGSSVCVGNTTTYTNATPGGVWSSSDPSIATIDNTGKITGISAGTATISYTVTNENNCSTTVTAIVTVNALPTATTSKVNVVCAGASTGSITVTPTSGTAPYQYSIDGGVTYQSGNTFSGLSVGNYSVYIKDANTCSNAVGTVSIIQVDNILPTISCPAPVTVQCASNVPAANIASVTASDNCSVTVTFVGDVISNQTAPNKYTITRTYKATDPSGNTATCTQIITVNDNIPPVIICPSNITITATSASGAVVNYIEPVGTDNCSGVTTTRTAGLASGSSFPIGVTTVTYRATDASGNFTDCSFTVTVSGLAPQIICPSNITVDAIAGQCGANVPFAATETVGIPASTIIYSIAPGSFFAVGTTIVTATASNAVGSSTCSFTVTVKDVTPPAIICAADITINNTPGLCTGTATLTAPSVTDNCNSAVNNALKFDGADDNVQLSGQPINPSSFTVEGWINGSSFANSGRYNRIMAINYGTYTSDNPFCLFVYSNGQIGYVFGNGSAPTDQQVPISTSPVLATNTWYHVALSFDGNTKRLYVNGVLAATINSAATFANPNNEPLLLGDFKAGEINNGQWNGLLDEVRIWNVARTQTQISANMNTDINAQPGLVAVYHLNQGTAAGNNAAITTAIDASGNGVTGTLNSFALNGTTSNWVAGQTLAAVTLTNNAPAVYPIGTTTVTWTATDAAGNTSTCDQKVTVIDNQPPVLTGVPANVTVECNAVPSVANVTATDNCSTSVPTFTETRTNGTCANNYTLTRRWSTTDASNNTTTATQIITVQDTKAPVINCPLDMVVPASNGICSAVVNYAATATDNCGGAVTIAYSTAPGSIFNLGTTTVTVTATDVCGNQSTCSFKVTVTDNQPPIVITKPITVALDATGHASITAADIDNGSNDNCGPVSLSLLNTGIICAQVNEGQNLTLTAPVGTVITAINFASYGTPNGTCGNFTLGSCNATNTKTIIEGLALNHNSFTVSATNGVFGDPCGGTFKRLYVQATYSGGTAASNTFDCSNLGNNNVTLKVSDANGNVSTGIAVVTVVDNIKPVINCPSNINVIATSAAGRAVSYVAPVGTDNCSVNTVRTAGLISGSTFPIGVTTVTHRATDASGNFTECSFTVTVSGLAPQIVCPANITVNATAGQCGANVTFAATETVGIPASVISYKENSVTVTPGSFFSVGTHTITATATNAVGSSSCNFTITVVDNQPPVLTGVPANVTVECDAVPAAAVVTATDNCSTSVPTYTEVRTDGNCANSYILTRTWSTTDASNNTTTATQIITVQDTKAPVLSAAPADVTVSCDAIPAAAVLTAGDNCDAAPVVSFAETSTQLADLGNVTHYNYTITRVWTATDACGNTSSKTQIITVHDVTAPIITCPESVTVNCQDNNTSSATGVATATDNCSPVTITQSDVSTQNADVNSPAHYNYTITRTWRATDVTGNYSECVQTITVHDVTAPIITCPESVTVNCQDNNTSTSTGVATATDNCSPVTITQSDVSTQNADVNSPAHYNYTITRTWRATDVTGNYSECVQTITVHDVTAPIIICPESVTVNCQDNNTSSATGVATATDNCSPVAITQSDVSTQSADVNSPAHYNYTITRTWRATDVTGNYSECVQTITVHDVTAPIITCPASVTVNCQDNNTSASTGVATATDNCGPVTITQSDASTYNADPSNVNHYNYVITRTWKATDVAGNFSTCIQTITVQDITKPVLNYVPGNITVVCSAPTTPSATGMATGTDNCASPAITYTDVVSTNGLQITRTWKATDVAGNFVTGTPQIITILPLSVTVTSVPTSNVYTGGSSTNLYIGYGAQSTVLQVNASSQPAAGAPYTYSWSGTNLSQLNSISSPAPVFTVGSMSGYYTYTVTVTNRYGCSKTATINICVTDVRVPGSNGKVYVCHLPPGNTGNRQTLSVSVNAVDAHLTGHAGDRLGSCEVAPCVTPTITSNTSIITSITKQAETSIATTEEELKVTVMPNPSTTYFTLKLESKYETPVNMRVMDGTGRVVDAKSKIGANSMIQIGHNYSSGTYYAELIQGNKRKVVQLIKAKG